MAKRIGDKIEIEFWERLEINLKIGETELQFKGWQAALMREFIINGAAMTVDGAHSLVLANGVFEIGSELVVDFLFRMHDEGWLKTHKEPMNKEPDRERLIISSNLQPDQFLHKIIVHKEEK